MNEIKNEVNILYFSKLLESLIVESNSYYEKLVDLLKDGKRETIECKSMRDTLIKKIDFIIKICELTSEYCKLNTCNNELIEKMNEYIEIMTNRRRDLYKL